MLSKTRRFPSQYQNGNKSRFGSILYGDLLFPSRYGMHVEKLDLYYRQYMVPKSFLGQYEITMVTIRFLGSNIARQYCITVGTNAFHCQ